MRHTATMSLLLASMVLLASCGQSTSDVQPIAETEAVEPAVSAEEIVEAAPSPTASPSPAPTQGQGAPTVPEPEEIAAEETTGGSQARSQAPWACQAAPITPPTGVAQVLDAGCIEVTIAAGEIHTFDGRPVLEQQNIQPPACPGFRMAFTWQVTSAGQAPVDFFFTRGSVEKEPIADGVSGGGNGYCGMARSEHGDPATVTLDLRYLLIDECPSC